MYLTLLFSLKPTESKRVSHSFAPWQGRPGWSQQLDFADAFVHPARRQARTAARTSCPASLVSAGCNGWLRFLHSSVVSLDTQ